MGVRFLQQLQGSFSEGQVPKLAGKVGVQIRVQFPPILILARAAPLPSSQRPPDLLKWEWIRGVLAWCTVVAVEKGGLIAREVTEGNCSTPLPGGGTQRKWSGGGAR